MCPPFFLHVPLHEQPWLPSCMDQDGVATSRKAELFTFDQSQFVHDLMIFDFFLKCADRDG